jgi:hypothetical protein
MGVQGGQHQLILVESQLLYHLRVEMEEMAMLHGIMAAVAVAECLPLRLVQEIKEIKVRQMVLVVQGASEFPEVVTEAEVRIMMEPPIVLMDILQVVVVEEEAITMALIEMEQPDKL